MSYIDARNLAYRAGAASNRPNLAGMFGLYGRGGGSGGSAGDERRHKQAKAAAQQAEWDREDQVRNEQFAQQTKLAGIRHNAPQTREELAAHLDRKRQEAAILGKTFDQQKELLGLKQSGVLDAIVARGDQSRQTEGVRQAGRVDLEDMRQDGRVEIEGVRQGNRIGLEDHRQGNRSKNIEQRGAISKFLFGEKSKEDRERQKIDNEQKMARLQETLKDKALSREERAWYNKEMIKLKEAGVKEQQERGLFDRWFKPVQEDGRNTRAAAAQAGATQRNNANIAGRAEQGDKNRAAAGARFAVNLTTRLGKLYQQHTGNPDAKFIVNEANKAAKFELFTAEADGADESTMDAIIEKHEQRTKRALERARK